MAVSNISFTDFLLKIIKDTFYEVLNLVKINFSVALCKDRHPVKMNCMLNETKFSSFYVTLVSFSALKIYQRVEMKKKSPEISYRKCAVD